MRLAVHLFLCWAMFSGCAAHPSNSSFPVTSQEAKQAIEQMRHQTKPLSRPLVVVGGFMDLNVTLPWFAHFFSSITRDTAVIPVSIGHCGSFEQCREEVIRAVDNAAPSVDPQWTSEVDVVGLSLGGL